MRKIVSDTGPILHLRETGSLDLLRKAGRIFIPPMVDLELLSHISSWKKLKYSGRRTAHSYRSKKKFANHNSWSHH